MSVVVAAFSGEAALLRCLESLAPQCRGIEVIVATAGGAQAAAKRFPSFRILPAAAAADVFRLRALGVAEASGRLVAMIEDHCTASAGWVEALREGHDAGHPVVGGPVANGNTASAFDWALYLCEYGAYMPPLPEGPIPRLLAVNISYDRDLLLRCRGTWGEAFYENEVQDALRGAGLWVAEKAVVTSHLPFSPAAARAHLFRGGRRYGAHRSAQSSRAVRAILPVAALAVPPLLVARRIRTVLRRRPELMGTVLRALPHVVALDLAWGAGEAAGYLAPRKG